MSGWSEDPRQSTSAGERPDEGAPAGGAPRGRWGFRLSFLVLALAAGLAVASPFQRAPEDAAACGAQAPPGVQVIVLPPGHPPIPGLAAPASPTVLPPGHPPIDAEALGRRARPLPSEQPFQPPATVDL